MTVSPRLSLPMLVPGQAQKDWFHNEALQLLDVLVQPVIEEVNRNDPPPLPSVGETYIVGPAPSSAWIDQPFSLACWTEGGWRFCAPFEGLEVTISASGERACFRNGDWIVGVVRAKTVTVGGEQVLSSRFEAIANPVGGSVVDLESRGALAKILSAMRHHGLIGEA